MPLRSLSKYFCFVSDDIAAQNQAETATGYVGRKRFREPDKHKKAVRKKKRNCGEEYISSSKKLVPAKQFSNADCKCKNKCLNKVAEDQRRKAFENFWKIGNFSTQNAFLCGVVKQNSPQVHRPRTGTRPAKSATNRFFVTSIQVCKHFFLNTYNISNGRLSRALK